MKKLFVCLLFVFVCLSILAGCSEKSPASLTLAEFEEKYKRADYDAFLADPSAFVSDLVALNTVTKSNSGDLVTKEGWDVSYENTSEDGSSTWSMLEKDCVLFNKPFSYNASSYVNHNNGASSRNISVCFQNGDSQKDLELSLALYSYLVKKCGDPDRISIDSEAADEPSLLRILNGSDDPQSFTVDFGSSYSLSFFAYQWRAGEKAGSYQTHITLYAYPDLPIKN